jgi:hypothetical protein
MKIFSTISVEKGAGVLGWSVPKTYEEIRNDLFPAGVVAFLGKKKICFNEEKLRAWITEQPQLISVREAAVEYLDSHPATVYDGVREGVYPEGVVVRPREGQVRFHRQKLVDWIESGGNYRPQAA